jgi:hypothetical protein
LGVDTVGEERGISWRLEDLIKKRAPTHGSGALFLRPACSRRLQERLISYFLFFFVTFFLVTFFLAAFFFTTFFLTAFLTFFFVAIWLLLYFLVFRD